MMELFECRLNLADHPMSQAELVQAVKEADVLVPTLTDRIDARLLSQAGSNLRLIASTLRFALRWATRVLSEEDGTWK